MAGEGYFRADCVCVCVNGGQELTTGELNYKVKSYVICAAQQVT